MFDTPHLIEARPRRSVEPGSAAALGAFLLGLVFAAFPVAKAVREVTPAANKDYSLWFRVGETVRAGGPLYRCVDSFEVQYMYPPTLAVLVLAPLSAVGYPGFVASFAMGNAAAWALCVWLAPRLAAEPGGRIGWAAALLPAGATAAYAWDMFHLGQVNLFLLALVLLAATALRHRRPTWAGVAVGLAVAVKVFPLPVVVYFVARREWRAVAATSLATAFFAALLPAAARGWDRTAGELREWAGLMVGDQSGQTMAARSSIGFTWRNSSLASVAHRLLRPVSAGERGGVPFRVNVADVSPRAAQLAGFGGCAVLGGVLLWATRLRFAPTPAAEGQEWGMVLALVVLCSPLSWTYFFCWLLPGWAAAMRAGRLAATGCAVAGLLLAAAGTQGIDPILSAYGATTWGAVSLFLTLAWLRRRETV